MFECLHLTSIFLFRKKTFIRWKELKISFHFLIICFWIYDLCRNIFQAFFSPYILFAVSKDRHELGLFNFGLWLSTIVFASLSIVLGLVALGFTLLNFFTKPIETITGPIGLYLWNSVACKYSSVYFLKFHFFSHYINTICQRQIVLM